ncbi:MAG: hypothetical protein ABIK44_03140 [candidate division WOR-3 bacterium]
MKAAFPYMGNIALILEPMLRELGADVVLPPPPTRATLELGTRLAPEMMCIPFKVTLGNMVKCLEMGADTLIYVSGSWSCRFGYYGRLQADILSDLGFRFELLQLRHDQLPLIARKIISLCGSFPRALLRTIRMFRLGWYKSIVVEEAERLAQKTMPYVQRPLECQSLLSKILREIGQTSEPARLRFLRRSLPDRFSALSRNGRTRVPRIRLVGESYCVLEPFINFNIIQRLGTMGVLVDPFLTARRWLGFHGFRLGASDVKRARRASRPYWRYCVGGEDENSVGQLILAARTGYDGVIHLHPFACMPGTVVQPTLAQLSRELNIPFLSLSLDEHTAEASLVTRLEAFVSLLEKRQQIRR